ATFANRRQDVQQEITAIQGTKLWKDFGNHFGLRQNSFTEQGDSEDKITLTLYRYANSQPGQGNGIAEQEVDNVIFTGDVSSPSTDQETLHSTWHYPFTADGDTVLEQYAPNGMPWIYVVKEELNGDLTYYEKETDKV